MKYRIEIEATIGVEANNKEGAYDQAVKCINKYGLRNFVCKRSFIKEIEDNKND